MAAQNKCSHVFHRDVKFFRQEMAKTRAVQNACHAAHPFMRQARKFAQGPNHRVQWVGDTDHKSVGRMIADAFANRFHDLEVDPQKIIAAHARLTRNTCGHNAYISARNISVIIRALKLGIEFFRRPRFGDIKSFALRGALGDIKKDNVAQFF